MLELNMTAFSTNFVPAVSQERGDYVSAVHDVYLYTSKRLSIGIADCRKLDLISREKRLSRFGLSTNAIMLLCVWSLVE
jgi:hypothetical protein